MQLVTSSQGQLRRNWSFGYSRSHASNRPGLLSGCLVCLNLPDFRKRWGSFTASLHKRILYLSRTSVSFNTTSFQPYFITKIRLPIQWKFSLTRNGTQWNIKKQLSSYNTFRFLPCRQPVLDACIPDDDHYSLHQLLERRRDLVKTGIIWIIFQKFKHRTYCLRYQERTPCSRTIQ